MGASRGSEEAFSGFQLQPLAICSHMLQIRSHSWSSRHPRSEISTPPVPALCPGQILDPQSLRDPSDGCGFMPLSLVGGGGWGGAHDTVLDNSNTQQVSSPSQTQPPLPDSCVFYQRYFINRKSHIFPFHVFLVQYGCKPHTLSCTFIF